MLALSTRTLASLLRGTDQPDGGEDLVRSARPLDPADVEQDPVVDDASVVADGCHRVGGMCRWALDRGLSLDQVSVDVVVCDDDRVSDAADAENPDAQARALAAIYREAYA